jgi:hypothetical protein
VGANGRILTIVNAGVATATISNNSGSSLAANRITTGTGADAPITVGSAITLIYDSTASLWRLTSDVAGGSGSGITSLSLAGTTGTPQSIANGDTITIARGASNNLTAVAGATDTVTVDIVSNPTFTGLVTGLGYTAGAGLIQGSGGLSVSGNTTLATTAGNTATIGNTTGILTLTGAAGSTFALNGVTIDATEFNRLDGKDAPLVDTNDAVTTAIIGTGALSGGSIASGFGTISTGNNITTTATVQGSIVNATTGFRVNNLAATGQYLRGNGTNFVSSSLLASDLSGDVTLGTQTAGNYLASLGTATGLTIGGTNNVEGGVPTLAVNYGAAANTAVQGNVTFTCPSGTGNLSGTGNTITLGTGGTCAALTVVNNPTFSGLVTAQAGLNITNGGSLATQANADYSTVGTTNNVNLGAGSLVRLTGASAQTITGISGGANGRILTIVNAGVATATISNNSGSSLAANRITTGTGADAPITVGSAITLIYDSTASLWRLTSDVAGGSGSGITSLSLAGTTGTPQSIANGDTITIARGASNNLTAVAGATDTVTVDIVSNPTFTGLVDWSRLHGWRWPHSRYWRTKRQWQHHLGYHGW